MTSRQKTIRFTADEFRCLKRAAAALGQAVSEIVQAGVVEEAHKMGFFAGVLEISPPYMGVWPYIPERGQEISSARTTLTFDPGTSALLERAAGYVRVSESVFAIGAALRYLASLKAATPTGPLRRVALPAQFEQLVAARRT